jgi:hypothetical protein
MADSAFFMERRTITIKVAQVISRRYRPKGHARISAVDIVVHPPIRIYGYTHEVAMEQAL